MRSVVTRGNARVPADRRRFTSGVVTDNPYAGYWRLPLTRPPPVYATLAAAFGVPDRRRGSCGCSDAGKWIDWGLASFALGRLARRGGSTSMRRGDLTRYVAAVVLLLAACVSVAIVVVRHGLVNRFAPGGFVTTSDEDAGTHDGQGNGSGTMQARSRDRDRAPKPDRGGPPPASSEPSAGGLAKRCLVGAQLVGPELATSGGGGMPNDATAGRRRSEAAGGVNEQAGVTAEVASDVSGGQPTESSKDSTEPGGARLSAVAAAVDGFYSLLNQSDVTHQEWRQIYDQLAAAIEREPEDPDVPDALYVLSLFRYSDAEVKRCLLEQLLVHPRAYDSLKIMALEELWGVYGQLNEPVKQMWALSERGQLILGLSDERPRPDEPSLREWWLNAYYEDFWMKAAIARSLMEEGLLDSPDLPPRERGKKASDHLQELLDLMPQIRAAPPPNTHCDFLESQTLGLLGAALRDEAIYQLRATTGREIRDYELPRDDRRADVYRRLRLEFPHRFPAYRSAELEAEARDPTGGEEYVRVLEAAERDVPADDLSSKRSLLNLIVNGYVRLQRGRPIIERLEPLVLAGNPDLKAAIELEALPSWHWPGRPGLSVELATRAEAFRLLCLGVAYACPDVADYARAVEYYQQVLASPAADVVGPQTYELLVRAYEFLRDYQSALVYLEELIAKYPERGSSRWAAQAYERLRAAVDRVAAQSGSEEEEQ